ncbi:uncharacterized kinase-like protein D1044.1 isoform X1 [Leguminivora glycinivorella]|uniref:uncharacterized kinase-like protein D1044.1 isoform X1 n=1 Tax=Leguminivora glycinivorella TaxID=1035111 RepID=UPI00200C1201|nr:uncharacterized kinase-like protein D1044.1 isoform X1 [Leguminivora glycinivorella]XP_048000111.1 uncharacterized kinase-like protein D1044.1 isoform X1 [Leguminivora glycinivorella]XP_048000117.1 uncharacterized kinase-like protein D1044.1 isoform X1 [Leguminivora glycinivorella]
MENFKEKILKWSHKIASEHKFNAGYKINVQQVTGTGYSSATFKITVSEANRELKMFAKIANIMEDLRNSSYIRLFTDELHFYTDITKIFKELENQYNVLEKDRFLMPKCYGGDLKPREETIILEDMSNSGFSSVDQHLPFDWDFASKSVEQLAKFHAFSFAYGVLNPAGLTQMLESKPYHVFDSPVMRRLGFDQTVPLALDVLDADLKQLMQQYLESQDRFSEFLCLYRSAKPRVLAHGDYKINNLMTRQHEGRLEMVTVDFQNIHASNPATDLVYFIMLGSDAKFRAHNLRRLLDHYYAELERALSRFCMHIEDIYPKDTFEGDWNQALPIGLLAALMILPITLADPAAMAAGQTKEMTEIVSSNATLRSRITEIVRDFIAWGVLTR